LIRELLQEIRELRFSRLLENEYANCDGRCREMLEHSNHPLDLTYGQTHEDVQNQPGSSFGFLTLKEARSMIPEFDGNSRNRMREFINVASHAMKNIHPADEQTLLEAILCIKFKGKAMVDLHTRDVRSYEQLKHELEVEYLSKRSTAHLQLEFNSLKQKAGENAQDFGCRVDVLATVLELFKSMEEDQNHTVEQQRAIFENIKLQALHNFQIGLHEDIKLLV